MVRFYYLLTSEAERRNGLRLLAEEDVTIEDEAAGVCSRESRRYPARKTKIHTHVREAACYSMGVMKNYVHDLQIIVAGNPGQGGYGMVFRDDTGNYLKVFRSKTLVSQLLTRLNVNSIIAAAKIAFSEIWWRLVIVIDSKAAAQAYSNIFDKETVIENEVIKSSRMCSQRVRYAVEGRFHIKVAELCERYFRQLPYDVVLPRWPLKVAGLDDEGRSNMHSKPIYPMSKLVVSSSLKKTSSLGREDDSSVMEDTVDKVEMTVGVKVENSSKVEKVIKIEDTKEKDKLFVIYPEGLDAGKKNFKYKKKLQGEWGNYMTDQGRWFRAYIPEKGRRRYIIKSLV
ncbi:hypothetical protein GIB67_029994 [Kingdonia uniflora]|uniref:RNase H type-1 domain-containing protein n=1 Tax=Kingdonia uniflora TaxID=39325 RepID=A0A7J7MXZ1_9MAGN|nr:hypothetical protein GIB67_029994 [Kingdonia uniflora]